MYAHRLWNRSPGQVRTGVMKFRPLGFGLLFGVLLLSLWKFLLSFQQEVDAAELRSLSNFQILHLPPKITPLWRLELQEALEGAPEVKLLDPSSLTAARKLLTSLPWVDPVSIQVERHLPDGIRMEFQPRKPRLLAHWRGKYVAISRKGITIPKGLPEEAYQGIAVVPLDDDVQLPPPGRRVAHPLIQEALACADEYYAIRRESGLDLIGMERMPGYPKSTPGVPPALSFFTRDGRRILWGRAEKTKGPLRIPLEQKARRLHVVLTDYPKLEGVSQVHLHTPLVRLFSEAGERLPLPSMPGLAE